MADNSKERLTFMAVHAHPDDEVFGMGGTFARLSAEGVQTVLVTCTLGEVGEIVDPTLDEETKKDYATRLGEIRIVELQNSVAALGITELKLLGFRDSGMIGTEDNQNPASFWQANFDEAVKRLVKLIREFRPQVMATYGPFGGYGHPDHLQAHRVTVAAFDAAGDKRLYPEMGLEAWQSQKLYWSSLPRSFFRRVSEEMRAQGIEGPWNNPEMETDEWGDPDSEVTTIYHAEDYVDQKMEAFRAHKTQIAPDNFMFVIPAERRREGLGVEWYTLAKNKLPDYQPAGEENDLFAGIG